MGDCDKKDTPTVVWVGEGLTTEELQAIIDNMVNDCEAVLDGTATITEVVKLDDLSAMVGPINTKPAWMGDYTQVSNGEENEKLRKSERKKLRVNRGISRKIPRHGNNNRSKK